MRVLRWGIGCVVVAALAWWSFRPTPVLVDVATVTRGALHVTADDDGRTRVRERYVVSAALEGMLHRPTLDEGDRVVAGETVLARLDPRPAALLDARARAEAEARLRAARADADRARAEREAARADLEYAEKNLARERQLEEGGTEARRELDRAVRDEARARQALEAAGFAVQAAEHRVALAEAALAHEPAETEVTIVSPVDGRVLRVIEESAGVVTAGAPLIEVGNVDALEIVADYLSQDAVRIARGMEVEIRGWGGEASGDAGSEQDQAAAASLAGVVRRVEPSGFTKVSALGVEEQRVNVLVDPADPDRGWLSLGDGYRVELRILLDGVEDVPRVPTGALFRADGNWSVFVVEDGRARQRTVELGLRNGLQAEVRSGVVPGAQVVLYPSELIEDGARVEARR